MEFNGNGIESSEPSNSESISEWRAQLWGIVLLPICYSECTGKRTHFVFSSLTSDSTYQGISMPRTQWTQLPTDPLGLLSYVIDSPQAFPLSHTQTHVCTQTHRVTEHWSWWTLLSPWIYFWVNDVNAFNANKKGRNGALWGKAFVSQILISSLTEKPKIFDLGLVGKNIELAL